MSKVVTVFGCTGTLGGSVARSLAQDYTVRGVTRDPDGAAASSLKQCGIQVVRGDHTDPRSLEDALDGAHCCFVVTNPDFSCPDGYQREVQQGKAIADACKKVGVNHVVYSTQLNVVKVWGMSAKHMDAKAEVELYMKNLGLPLTCVIVPMCCYETLLLPPLRPKRVAPDQYELMIPMGHTPLDVISANDVGPVVRAAFADPQSFLHKTLSLSGSKLTVKEIAAILAKHLPGKCFKDKQVTVDDYRRYPFGGADDMATMFDFFVRVDQRASMDLTKKLNPEVQTFEQWVWSNSGNLGQALDYPSTPPGGPWQAV